MPHSPSSTRYENPGFYRRCGRSGLKLPAISLGLWHNFGAVEDYSNSRALVLHAFDAGITHFDLANNYGPPPGSAEETFGRILHDELAVHRDELIVSTKAGYTMWDGPYGDWGSRVAHQIVYDNIRASPGAVLTDLSEHVFRHGFD